MDNLAYAATTSNNVVEELIRTNAKLIEQLKTAQEENTRLLKIIELSVTAGSSTAMITPLSGKANITNRRLTTKQQMHSWNQKGIVGPADIVFQRITQVSTATSRSQVTSWVPRVPTSWAAARHTTGGNQNDKANQ
eukprot:8589417-Ditylum_brightwellii.AAC.1